MVTRTRLQLREHTASLLSRKWTFRIVRTLGSSVKRHSEITKLLPGITQKVLTETLREMERCGIIERRIYPVVPPHVEYKLTSIGVGLLKLSSEFSTWFDIHHEKIHHAERSYSKQHQIDN